jgi:hypothetical protein
LHRSLQNGRKGLPLNVVSPLQVGQRMERHFQLRSFILFRVVE